MHFDHAYEQYKPMIFAMLRKLNIYKDYDDYFQIGCIALWQACESYNKSIGPFEVYVFMQIKYAMLVELRRNAKKQQREQVQEELPEQTSQITLHETIFIEQLLQFLTEEERLIVINYYLEGYKNEEIAKKLGKKTDTIKKKRQRAIQKLKEHYKNVNSCEKVR